MVLFGLLRRIFRFAGYGFLFFGTIAVFFFADIPGRIALFITGGLVLSIGLILLVTFIQKNRIIPNEVDSAY
jgi:hypothetical protein